MNRRRFTGTLAVLASVPFVGGWLTKRGKPQTDQELKGMGYIVVIDQYEKLAEEPSGGYVYVTGITDAGNWIISTRVGKGESHSSFGGGGNMSFPRWVKVYYRKLANPEDIGKKIDPLTGRKIDTLSQGDIFAEHHVEVLSRIPEEVFEFLYASPDPKLKRAIRLKFRIKEDGVLFAWDVQQMDFRTPDGGLQFAMMGGDFLDNMGHRPFRPAQLIDMTKERE